MKIILEHSDYKILNDCITYSFFDTKEEAIKHIIEKTFEHHSLDEISYVTVNDELIIEIN